MKGKVKSIYENMKNLLDPTPRFDSHISKNTSKVTSLTSYRAFELTQHYFYEYLFDELRPRPRQVCPYAVVSFQFKGKDSALPSKPLAPIRLNSQSAQGSKERAQFTVWSGDLVQGDRLLYQISLRSSSPPFLPHKLPEKLEIGYLMRLDQMSKLVHSDVFSYNIYNSSQEVVKNGHCCSLLEVNDRSRSTTSITILLQELEIKRVVLVTPLTERGFLFLLSSVQMATPTERGESWKRCLQALFVFPETRDVSQATSRWASSSHDCSESSMSGAMVMPQLRQFIPALHHSLIKARANPPAELSVGVEQLMKEYFISLTDDKFRQYSIGEYDEQGKQFVIPKHHQVNMEGYLRSYLYIPVLYQLKVSHARQIMEAHCGSEVLQEVRPRKGSGYQKEAMGKEAMGTKDKQTNSQKMQQLIDLVMDCKKNAENEVRREEGGDGGLKAPGRKRRLEQQTAERTLKFLKASQQPGRHNKIPDEGRQVPAPPGSLASAIGSVGLKDIDLREDGSELAARLLSLLTGLNQAATGAAGQNLGEVPEEQQRDSCPFDRLATRLGLPTNCDIDLRRQEELEEQTAGSISSLEGFSPSSHSGEINHYGAAFRGGGGMGKRAGCYEEEEEEWEIPWVLIPITGLCSERYTPRDRNTPQDPRFQHLTVATSVTTTTQPPRKSPTPSPEPTSPPSPSQCPSPEPTTPPSPSQCPSPDPSSPESSPPLFRSQCLSPAPSPPTSPSQCPSPQPSPPNSSSQVPSPLKWSPPSPSQCKSSEPNELNALNRGHSGSNKRRIAPPAFREFAAVSKDREEKPQGKEKKSEASISACIPPAPEGNTIPSQAPTDHVKEDTGEKTGWLKEMQAGLLEKEKQTQPAENLKKQRAEAAKNSKQYEEEVVGMTHEAVSERVQKGVVKDLVGASLFSSSVSSSPTHPLRDIDSIVDKHLGDFASEMQLLLQGESIHYSLPQSPHSTSNPEATIPSHMLPPSFVSQFSQYVSFYNPCPPVQDYVNSLHDSINSMLTELESSSSHSDDTRLAGKVGAYVSSIRAANVKTGVDDEVSVNSGDLTAAADGASADQAPALCIEGDVWLPDAVTKRFPDATNSKSPPTSHDTLSVPTSACGSAYKSTNTADLHPPPATQSQWNWKPQQSHTSEINSTVAHNVTQTLNGSTFRTVHCATDVEAGSSLVGSSCKVTLPGLSGVSNNLAQSSCSSEPVSSSVPVSIPGPGTGPTPPATALSSVISQLEPEVFSSLLKIIKDVRKNSLNFYLHDTEPGDQLCEDVKEHLLKQGNVEQSPGAFLNQEDPDNRLLVIIKNKDIAGHIHKIPGLVSLKQHPSVVFVGIDTLDDIRNNSYNELFVSGGCIVSDELILNPDFITHDQLAALLMFLEEHSSLESVWKWKVHCKTHKKLKEQARFRRDAASLLDLLSAYQKRQIVEFLPYHHCDMINHQSPDLDCIIELQARYTQYRHTIFLTEHHHERFTAYSSSGIIVAGIEKILHNFTGLVGYHDIRDKQPIMDDLLAAKSLDRQLSHGDSVSGSEHIHPFSSNQAQSLLQQPDSGLDLHPHVSDQLVPDASYKDAVPPPSHRHYEVLQLAISHLRAERQAQQQQQLSGSQVECSINPHNSFLLDPVHTGSGHTPVPSVQGGPAALDQLTPGRKAVAATLDLIHSSLQPELEGEGRRGDRAELSTEGQRRGSGGSGGGGAAAGDQQDGTPGRVVGVVGGKCVSDTLVSSQNTAAVTGPSNQADSTSDRREKVNQQEEPAFPKHGASSSGTPSCSVEGSRLRDTPSGQEQPIRGEGAPPGNSTTCSTTVTGSSATVKGSIATVTGQLDKVNHALPQQQHLQQHSNQQQQLSEQPQLQPRLSNPPQLGGVSLLQAHHLHRLHQPFPSSPMLAPLTSLGGITSLLGPTHVWPGGLGPARPAALVWGFQQPATTSSLLGGFSNPAGQGSNSYRGGQRGGGFTGI
uniref:uncharacterized protein tasora n=1 Tax=Monopterus albus TaxID=43700 RepID=UPI0009B3EE08|nr:protein TASOR [Monopterus albus]